MCSGQVLWKLLQFHSVHMQIVLATAAPDKFPEAVEEAGLPPVDNPAIRQLFNMETRLKTMAPKSERRQGSSLSYPTCRRKSNKVICFKIYSSTLGSIRRSANYLSFIQGVRVIIKNNQKWMRTFIIRKCLLELCYYLWYKHLWLSQRMSFSFFLFLNRSQRNYNYNSTFFDRSYLSSSCANHYSDDQNLNSAHNITWISSSSLLFHNFTIFWLLLW